ncbi:hypothetical protein ACHHYP_03203 [Achlya hypogyna]|uniref:EGF-like domain-containing protein n=1 Tax=Achlya hypogyna TaxID=1202772 RepID=A0A1V9Z457_ACHHY|nr:hypothetical protein ACHHYP_03203 [Achlya hypogyna]
MVAFLLRGLAVAAIASVALAACPNKCSGHGTCGANDICSCEQNWVNPDCSGRLCPFTRAWHDTATYSDDAHYYAECGNRGQCDRSTGICNCDSDFSGSGCRRMRCPNDCSGHGVCLFMEELASLSADPRIHGTDGFTYTKWDREKIQGCQCDPGWEGYSCNQRVCPKGDDPLTVNDPKFPAIPQSDMYQGIVLSAVSMTFVLKYTDPYGNTWSTSAITSDTAGNSAVTCTRIQTALQRIPNLALYTTTLSGEGQVTATLASVRPFVRTPINGPTGVVGATVANSATVSACVISFPAGPGTTGYQYPLQCDVTAHTMAGSQPLSAGSGSATCTIYEHYSGTAAAAATVDVPFTELATCSNRGTCNSDTGTCTCFAGHKGLACELQEALV